MSDLVDIRPEKVGTDRAERRHGPHSSQAPHLERVREVDRCGWGLCEAEGSVRVTGAMHRPSPMKARWMTASSDDASTVGVPFSLCVAHAESMTRMLLRLEYPDGRIVFKGDSGLSC